MALDVNKPKGYRRSWRGGIDLTRVVTVCDACHQASCWHGKFFCDRAQGAGTVDLTLATLMGLRLENEEYWFTDPANGIIDRASVDTFRRLYPEACSGLSE